MKNKHDNLSHSLPLRILVIDDNAMFRRDIISLLKRENNVKVIGSASNGIRGMSQFARLKPDLVLLDINMPGMAGPEIAYNMKRVSPSIKIIYVSFHEKGIYAELLKLQKVDGYIQKSSLKDELPKVLKKLVNNGNGKYTNIKFVQCRSI